jgi:amidase
MTNTSSLKKMPPRFALFLMPPCVPHGITLAEATIDQLQHYMRTGKLTSVQLLECYLTRIS